MIKLTDLQLILLSAASQRDDGSLMPPPESVGERSTAIDKAIASLVRQGLAAELDTSDVPSPAFKDPDPLVGVRITTAGRSAIGVADKSEDQTEGAPTLRPVSVSTKKGTKASQVLAMLQRATGATLDELVAATDWLPHTTRAALTGLRKKGHVVISEKVEGQRRYRIAAESAQTADAQ